MRRRRPRRRGIRREVRRPTWSWCRTRPGSPDGRSGRAATWAPRPTRRRTGRVRPARAPRPRW
ncbi:hypothetical protein FGG90_08075 [Clavibacter tessellarius]|nr:hypothetical protein FGG90_08075 [Clavibacter michiganensis subsp. tessellarius]